jgi:membrane fusion protein (multidrug efflux system)
MNLKQGFILLALFCYLTAAGCGKGNQDENNSAAGAMHMEKVTNVTVRTVVLEDLQEMFTLPGSLEAWEDLTLAAELAGPVRWIGPQEGDRIKKGEAILRIDPETLEANLSRAQADFDLHQSSLKRLEALVAKKLVSQQEYEDGRQAFEVAGANLKAARVALDKSTLTSPVDGVLDRLFVDQGEYIAAGDPAALVVQVDRLKALVDVPEKDVSFLRVGQEVRIYTAAMNAGAKEGFDCEIIYLAYKADPTTRTYLAKIAVDNQKGRLRPGMIIKAVFSRLNLHQVVAVPMYALIDREGEEILFVEQEGVARLRKVKTGPVVGEKIVIEKGLAAGERLIVKGQHLVGDGMPVREVKS